MSEKRWERLRRKNLRQRRNNCWGNKQGIKIYGNEYLRYELRYAFMDAYLGEKSGNLIECVV